MLWGYIRVSKAGPSLEEQIDFLRKAGCDDISVTGNLFIDDLARARAGDQLLERERAISGLQAGDTLVIAKASRLGVSASDIVEALKGIAIKQAHLLVADSGLEISPSPNSVLVLDFIQTVEDENKDEAITKMRQARLMTGNLGGAPKKYSKDVLESAKRLWGDPRYMVSQIVEETGISRRTLYRCFGERTFK